MLLFLFSKFPKDGEMSIIMGTPSTILLEKPVIKPEDLMSIRDNQQGAYTISVPPDRQQEFAEALYVLFTLYADQKKNHLLMDIIVERAKAELERTPGLMTLLAHRLVELTIANNDRK
jgi:hypothetical protein